MKLALAIAAALVAVQPIGAQQSIESPGTVVHRAARTGFAERVGAFRRVGATRYDDAGRDLSANYDLIRREGRVRASVYIYPALVQGAAPSAAAARRRLCDGEYSSLKEAIEQRHKDVVLVEETPGPAVAGVDSRLTHRSVHRFRDDIGGGAEDLLSESRLYCFVGGDWLVKYRISSSAGLDARAEIEAFLRDAAWPGRSAPGPLPLPVV